MPRGPGELRPLDAGLPDEVRELSETLRTLRDDAQVSLRELYRKANATGPVTVTSVSQVGSILSPKSTLPRIEPWARYEVVITALGGDPADLRVRWEEADAAFEARRTATPPTTPDPPVAAEPPDTDSAEERVTSPRRPARSRTRIALLTASLLVVALAAVLVVVLVGRDPVERARLDGSDPQTTQCSDPATDPVYFSTLFEDWPTNTRRTPAVVELHYSRACRTAWAVLRNAPTGSLATLTRLSDGAQLSCIPDASGTCETAQLDNADVLLRATARSPSAFGQTRDA